MTLLAFLRRKPPKPRPDFDTGELRSAARRLVGWKFTGTGDVNPKRLLYEAADEIDRLSAELEALRG